MHYVEPLMLSKAKSCDAARLQAAAREIPGGRVLDVSQSIPSIDFATLDLLPYGIIVVDKTGRILYYNEREAQISGRSRPSVLGKNFFTEVAPCTQVQEFHGRFCEVMEREGISADFHFRFPFVNRPREVEVALTTFRKDDELLCLISVSDVTERENVREQILRDQRFKEVGETAATVAHNFKNLVMVISGNAELLREEVTDERGRKYLDRILQATADSSNMMRRIQQSISGTKTAAHRPIRLQMVLSKCLDLAQDLARQSEQNGVHVEVCSELPNCECWVLGSEGDLAEVFLNLLKNAVEAIPKQGRVSVSLECSGDKYVVKVSDTGTGMSEEVRSKLFTPLFSTKGELGTGLGLTSAYSTLRLHNGNIEVQSELGRGTTFKIWLPAAKAQTSANGNGAHA